MDSMYGGMLPGVEMSDSPPEGMPDTADLISTALTHSDEHLQYEQPNEDTRSEYFQQEFPNGQPDITPQQVVKEPNEEATDADFWYVPENLPPQQQLQILNDKFNQVREYMQSDVYAQEIEQYKTQRINEMEQELSDFAIAYRALQTNPKDFMAQYLPEVLLEYGINPVLSQEEIAGNVQNSLKQMYGEDWQQRVDPAEMFIPGSFSSMVYQAQQSLYQKYQAQNAQSEALMKSWGEKVANGEINTQAQGQGFDALPVESQAQALVQEYEQNWKQAGYTEDEFAEFVAQAQQTNMSMQEVHKVVYFNDYLSAAYQQGLEQGKQAFYQQVQRTGNASPVQRQQQAQQSNHYERNDNEELVAAMRILSQGGIPAY